MGFAQDIAGFNQRLRQRESHLFVNVVSHVETSIKVGSPSTGAPGQPVDTGNLLNSYQTKFVAPRVAEVSTPVAYAPDVEDNSRGVVFKSSVGGAHSVRLTRAGFPAIVEFEAERVASAPAPMSSGSRSPSTSVRQRDERGRFVKR